MNKLCSYLIPTAFSFLLLLVPAASAQTYWVKGNDPDQIHLFKDGVKLGTWRYGSHKWYTYHPETQTWDEEPSSPPWDLTPIEKNYGVSREASSTERWIVDGRPVSREEGVKAISGGDVLPDDSKLPFMVFVGDPATGEKIEKDLQNSKDFSGKYRFQSYQVGDFGACDREGKPCYSPGLTCVSATRQALWHLKDYTTIEELASYVRKIDPNYDPTKVPEIQDLTESPVTSSPVPLGAATVLSLLSGVLLLKRSKS